MTNPIDEFCDNGFLHVRGAVAADVVRDCVGVIEDALREMSVDLRAPETWTSPVVRIPCPEGPAFAAAGTSPALWRMYDALLGAGRWVQRAGVGGSIPVRFPSTTDPGDAGWHIDGSYDVDGQWWVNVRSRARGLLALFLFSDVGENDTPRRFWLALTWTFHGCSSRTASRERSSEPSRRRFPTPPSIGRARGRLVRPAVCISVIRS